MVLLFVSAMASFWQVSFTSQSPSSLVCNVELMSVLLKGLLWGLSGRTKKAFEQVLWALVLQSVFTGTIRSLIPFFCSQTVCYIIEGPFAPRLLNSSLPLAFSVRVVGYFLKSVIVTQASGYHLWQTHRAWSGSGLQLWKCVSLWTRLLRSTVLPNKRNSPIDSLAELVFFRRPSFLLVY